MPDLFVLPPGAGDAHARRILLTVLFAVADFYNFDIYPVILFARMMHAAGRSSATTVMSRLLVTNEHRMSCDRYT